ncbi:hypothetical protein PybrP1_002533 [[Pythium] brassicae (nom. inval.)]|nr:hypothetical protein PybrP1_002533 [[Pythium] brassicae (nom. inval.)]
MLHFAKVYDSLDRGFMLAVLQKRGFLSVFVEAVTALHRDTSGVFLVNGYASKGVTSTCGIRQGCPLAPFLFIVALDVLYAMVDNYADIYLDILTRFGRQAGLKVNVQKSTGLWLGAYGG